MTNLLSIFLKTTNVSIELAAQLEGTENRIRVAGFDFNDAVSNYNSGFGPKIKYVPANEIENDVHVDFNN